jgi:hypothetical protein
MITQESKSIRNGIGTNTLRLPFGPANASTDCLSDLEESYSVDIIILALRTMDSTTSTLLLFSL